MKKVLLLLSSLFLLTGCSLNAKSPYDPYKSRENEDVSNIYSGDGNDFHIKDWYAADYGQIEVREKEDYNEVFYMKTFGYEYTSIYSSAMGPFADFTYVNILAKGTPGKNITMRLYCGEQENEVNNALGNDVSFSLTDDFELHSLKIKGTLKSRMDLLRRISILPEMGLSSVNGTFYLKDVYFSKTLPEHAKWENTGVDIGDTSVTVNGWRTEGWTNYSLYPVSGGTGVKYNAAAEWGFIETVLDIPDGHNALKFKFKNMDIGGKPSVSVIRFLLRGDVMEHISEGVEYEYDVYYEASVYIYDLTKVDEVQPDSEGYTTLQLSLENALTAIGENHVERGYHLTLLVESNPEDSSKYLYTKDGEMVIYDCCTYHGEFVTDYYYMIDQGAYVLSEKEGVEKNITYKDVLGNAYWPRINRRVVGANHGSTITMRIRNNGESAVKISVHAGMANDNRSDSDNNMFYPLWNTDGKTKVVNGTGTHWYYTDGADYDIDPGETTIITITVDENIVETNTSTEEKSNTPSTENDIINEIQLLVDNCYGDDVKRSGDIDIIDVTF